MPYIHYIHVESPDGSIITAYVPGAARPYVADNSHPNYSRIISGLRAEPQDIQVIELFDVAETVSNVFDQVSERVSVKDGHVYFDGDIVDNACTQQIIRFLNEGVSEDLWVGLVNFMEKVAANPNEHSREQLYRWLAGRDFTITAYGDFVGYKGVTDNLTSINSGPGIVNGESVNGHLDNSPGNIVEIARSYVQHDPSIGCHRGLHVGTFDYANSFGRRTLKVTVNPRDVVSVPTDCADAKVRCCRYEVIEEVEKPVTSAFDYSSDWDEDDDFFYGDEPEDDFDEPEDDEPYCTLCGGKCAFGIPKID